MFPKTRTIEKKMIQSLFTFFTDKTNEMVLSVVSVQVVEEQFYKKISSVEPTC